MSSGSVGKRQPLKAKEPRLDRGVKRVQSLLKAAEALFADKGYGATSMNAIAQQAKAPIGSLYQFFPSKEAIGGALVQRYTVDLVEAWRAGCAAMPSDEWQTFADMLIKSTLDCIARHPAFATLNEAQVQLSLRPESHTELAAELADLISARAADVKTDTATLLAHVTLQMLKTAYALQSSPQMQKAGAIGEISTMLGRYFEERLG